MNSLGPELGSALRRLIRHPGHTLALTGVLAVGLALALGMFEGFNAYLYWLQPLTAWAGQRIVLQRFLAAMFGMFAAAGLLFAATGLFAVLAQVVSARTAEIRLRRALGASSSGVDSMLARQNGLPVGVGLLAGLAAGVGLAHLIANEIVGVRPTDPLTRILAAVAVAGCAALASWLPASRAVRIEPATALRTE